MISDEARSEKLNIKKGADCSDPLLFIEVVRVKKDYKKAMENKIENK